MEAAWRGRAGGRLFYCSRHGEYVGRQLAVIALAAGPDGRRAELKPWKDYRS